MCSWETLVTNSAENVNKMKVVKILEGRKTDNGKTRLNYAYAQRTENNYTDKRKIIY